MTTFPDLEVSVADHATWTPEPAPGRVWQVPDDLEVPGHGDADTLVLAPVDPVTFDALVHEHGTESVATEVGQLVDTEALDAALLAACTVAPKLTVEQARELLDEWPAGECDDLLGQVFDLCPDQGSVDRAWWRLERDVGLRVEMGICTAAGISRSHFLGGPVLWSQTDRDLALAHELRRLATCPGCGTRPDEWERDREAYIPDVVGRDKGCEVKAEAEAQISEQGKEAGERAVLVPRDEFDRLDARREAEAEARAQRKARGAELLAERTAGESP